MGISGNYGCVLGASRTWHSGCLRDRSCPVLLLLSDLLGDPDAFDGLREYADEPACDELRERRSITTAASISASSNSIAFSSRSAFLRLSLASTRSRSFLWSPRDVDPPRIDTIPHDGSRRSVHLRDGVRSSYRLIRRLSLTPFCVISAKVPCP
jgi:hypothetical protein